MASMNNPQKPAPQPQHPRYRHADKPARDKAKDAKKIDMKDAPVIFSDWASI